MAKLTKMGGAAHSGQQSNNQIGVVTDNVDPEELGRIRVKFPTLSAEPVSYWIRQMSPGAGKERGLYSLPEKGDEVVVMFMQGSQEVGVCLGQFWNGTDKPPAEAKDGLPGPAKTEVDGAQWSTDTFTDGSKDIESNDRRFWKSRSGALMVFDDTDGAESVQFWDKSHKLSFVFDSTEGRIVLANNQGDIHIRSKNDVYIEAGNDIKWIAKNDIKGESGNDTIHEAKNNYKLTVAQKLDTKSGSDTTLKADANFKATAGSEFTAEGSASITVKSSGNAKLSAGGVCTISGSMVKIN